MEYNECVDAPVEVEDVADELASALILASPATQAVEHHNHVRDGQNYCLVEHENAVLPPALVRMFIANVSERNQTHSHEHYYLSPTVLGEEHGDVKQQQAPEYDEEVDHEAEARVFPQTFVQWLVHLKVTFLDSVHAFSQLIFEFFGYADDSVCFLTGLLDEHDSITF